jgi:hypothetical protein
MTKLLVSPANNGFDATSFAFFICSFVILLTSEG